MARRARGAHSTASTATLHSVLRLLGLVNQCTASCYWLDRTDVNAWWNVSEYEYYQPCHNVTASNATAASMCCATGPGRVAQGNADRCVENGLCYSDALQLYWRESCTDPTWQDAACIKLFVNGTNNSTDVPLTPCSDGSWCQQNVPGSLGCCEAGNGFVITQDGTVTQHNGSAVSVSLSPSPAVPVSSTFSSSNPSSSSTSTTSAPPPTSTVTQNPSSDGLTSGAEAGIGVGITLGVGIALGVVAAFLVCVYFVFRKSRRNKGLEGSQKVNEIYQPLPPGELQSNPVYAEMHQPQYAVPKRPGVETMSTPAQLE